MKIEVLYFDGCPNHRPAVERVRQVLAEEGLSVMRHILFPRTSQAISQLSSQIGDRTHDGCGIGYLLV
jgi:hypothetical protein